MENSIQKDTKIYSKYYRHFSVYGEKRVEGTANKNEVSFHEKRHNYFEKDSPGDQ